MKKWIVLLLCCCFLIPAPVFAEETLIENAKSGLLMEVSTGKILYEKNIHDQLPVASMTKMMSQILILENIEAGNLTWEEKIQVSANAAGFGGSQIYLQPNEIMTVRDLMKGISMASANDATVALAERIAGSEAEFVKLMNQKAKDIGLKNTNFMNCTGLDQENHYSSSYDMALIARELLTHEQILEFSSVYEDYLRVDTPNKFWLVNTNKLVRFYDGADGLKTGHTDAALYCMAVTAKRSNMRLLAIVLGEEVSKTRNAETTALLDYGFNQYKVQMIKSKDEILEKIHFDKAVEEEIDLVPAHDVSILMKKSEQDKQYQTQIKLHDVSLPIKKGEVVGKLLIKDGNTTISEVDVITTKATKKVGFFKLYTQFLRDLVLGI